MRTSATGRARSPRPHAQAGFTLVELLIVLTVVGLASATVVLAIPDARGSLTEEAERFAARAAAARDRAIIDANAISLRVTAAGYGFDRRVDSQWQALEREPFGDQSWTEGTSATADGGDAARILFDPTGLVDPARIVLVRETERVVVEIGADGEIDVDA